MNQRGPSNAIPAFLFAAVFLCYLPPGNMGCADSMWSIPTAVSLVDHGDPDLDEYLPLLQARDFHYSIAVGAHRYTIYPLGASIIAVPGVILLRPIAAGVMTFAPRLWSWLATVTNARGCPAVQGEPIIALHSWSEHLIASAIVAVAAVVMYLIAAGDLPVPMAIALALLFAFGTPAWSTASRSLWQHGPSMLMLAVALLIQRRGWRLIWLGAVLAFAYVIRPTNAIPAAAAGVWVLFTRPRETGEFLLGAASVLVPFLIFSYRVYDYPLPPYYRPSFFGGHNARLGEALAGNLISPSRGLLIYSPVFMFSLAGLILALRLGRSAILEILLACCIGAHAFAVAAVNTMWWGGASYGPRFFADMAPYLTFLLIPFLAWLHSTRGKKRFALSTAFALTALFSVAVHAQGALNGSTAMWNAFPVSVDVEPVRVWDWRQPQFLAGITFQPAPLPPVNLDAIACDAPPAAPEAPATVTNRGGTVNLEWPPASGNPAVYLLEVGSAPGLSDAGIREVRDLSHPKFTTWRVQPGRYHVRVRARNKCGDSPASPEITVVVR
jgi:hypothetical protein